MTALMITITEKAAVGRRRRERRRKDDNDDDDHTDNYDVVTDDTADTDFGFFCKNVAVTCYHWKTVQRTSHFKVDHTFGVIRNPLAK